MDYFLFYLLLCGFWLWWLLWLLRLLLFLLFQLFLWLLVCVYSFWPLWLWTFGGFCGFLTSMASASFGFGGWVACVALCRLGFFMACFWWFSDGSPGVVGSQASCEVPVRGKKKTQPFLQRSARFVRFPYPNSPLI